MKEEKKQYNPCPTGACPRKPHNGLCGCKCHKPMPKKDTIEESVKQIMQDGFDVAMGGDPFKSPNENKEIQEKEYDKLVKKWTKHISQTAEEARRSALEEAIEAVEKRGEGTQSWEDLEDVIKKI